MERPSTERQDNLNNRRTVTARTARVLIIGAGFAGLETARMLGREGIHVTVVDRTNHHLFQPLLYQVATAALASTDIAEPIRKILRPYPTVTVIYGEVERIDCPQRLVHLADGGELPYDFLILATGAQASYFGHDEWAEHARGLKTNGDAVRIRSRLLLAFEQAERTDNPAERQRLLTVAVIGGGPTGVEMAGSIAELARHTLSDDFRNIDPGAARVILIEGADRLLGAFPEPFSDYARRRLEELGVQVELGRMIGHVGPRSVTLGDDEIPVGLTIWAAGMEASPLGRQIGAPTDKMGRVIVRPDFSVEGVPDVFVIGDVSHLDGPDGKPLPGLAQVARQQGRHLGRQLARYLHGGAPVEPFVYRSRGNTAIIGRNAAVFESGRIRLKGFTAWMSWAIIHVYLLTGFQNRFIVASHWLWRYLTYERGARVVSGELPAPPVRPAGRAAPDPVANTADS